MFGKCAKIIEKNPPKHECARAGKLNLKIPKYVQFPWHIGRASTSCQGRRVFNPSKYIIFKLGLSPSQDGKAKAGG
jgi:hypothetical protein